ncbi:hypothetical protein C0Q70_02544 [Pomacea canaliculata]|uniref:Uncharacterized protein n=1 Tax=Pomacea canaliculata TaxID=400727 RepID=A0A2T7PQ75_POMCA|nr:hypothetical protein C0Q70_02544 [Pomacea canaliculata]
MAVIVGAPDVHDTYACTGSSAPCRQPVQEAYLGGNNRLGGDVLSAAPSSYPPSCPVINLFIGVHSSAVSFSVQRVYNVMYCGEVTTARTITLITTPSVKSDQFLASETLSCAEGDLPKCPRTARCDPGGNIPLPQVTIDVHFSRQLFVPDLCTAQSHRSYTNR